MFSFGKKNAAPPPAKASRPTAAPKSKNLAQLGLLGMNMEEDDDDDGDLEAELAMLTKGTGRGAPKKAQKPLVSEQELAAMVSSSLKDIPSDAEVSDVDDDEVEDELNELCADSGDDEAASDPPTRPPLVAQASLDVESKMRVLQERLAMYDTAEKNANQSGDSMKARRFGRGVKTLKDMLKQIQSGKPVSMADMPPILAESIVSSPSKGSLKQEAPPASLLVEGVAPPPSLLPKPLVPSRPAPTIPGPTILAPTISAPAAPPQEVKKPPIRQSSITLPDSASPEVKIAVERRNEMKAAALQAKRAGDQSSALQFVRQVKICDQLISAAQQGSVVDWSLLPTSLVQPVVTPVPPNVIEKPTPVEPVPPAAPQEASAIPIPKTTLEALEQRLAKYQSIMQQAQEENNSSKVRRFGRIVKQYQDAIKFHKAGKPVPFDELPDPPGYPPIPGAPKKVEEAEEGAEAAGPPVKPAALSPPVPAKPAATVSPNPPPKKTALATRQDKQLAQLLERQSMFKTAAIEAKKTGEMETAKEYLRMAKGIDPLISANKCGIPVDMDTLPIPPQMKLKSTLSKDGSTKADATSDEFVVLTSEEIALAPSLGQDSSTLLVQLEADLVAQLKTCSDNRDHYKLMGDIGNANRFDQLALHTRKDLDVVRSCAVRGDPVPRWKNEMRSFSIVKCCTDLKDDDMEVTIIRGLSYNVPNHKTIDTYVKLEAPFPNSDNPTREKTNTIYDTNNPEYNKSFRINFSRQSRTLLRIFKAKTVKFEVWSKGGFLRSDVLIGTASVKLERLLNHCQVHEAVDLMDGRKPVGGKLEIKIRLRDPIVAKEVEQVQEKWTVLIH